MPTIAEQYGRMRSTMVPEEFKEPRQARQAMPGVPAQARGARKRKGKIGLEAAAESLWSKAIRGLEAAGPGIVPYGKVPEAARKQVSMMYRRAGVQEQPIVGWDPRQLNARERAVLARLVAMGEGIEGRMM